MTVEMPYSTKVLSHELAGIPNIGLRFITSGDTERFRPLETKDKLTQEEAEREASAILEPIRISEEPFEEERIEAKEEEKPNEGLLGLMGAVLGVTEKSENSESEVVLEGAQELEKAGAEKGDVTLIQEAEKAVAEGVPNPIVQPSTIIPSVIPQSQLPVETVTVTTTAAQQPIVAQQPTAETKVITVNKQDGGGMTLTLRRANPVSQNTVIYPSPMPGAPPTIAVQGSLEQDGGNPPILTIDTGYEAMVDSGLMPLMNQSNLRPRPRRNGPLQLPPQIQQQYQQGGPSSGPIMVNKLG